MTSDGRSVGEPVQKEKLRRGGDRPSACCGSTGAWPIAAEDRAPHSGTVNVSALFRVRARSVARPGSTLTQLPPLRPLPLGDVFFLPALRDGNLTMLPDALSRDIPDPGDRLRIRFRLCIRVHGRSNAAAPAAAARSGAREAVPHVDLLPGVASPRSRARSQYGTGRCRRNAARQLCKHGVARQRRSRVRRARAARDSRAKTTPTNRRIPPSSTRTSGSVQEPMIIETLGSGERCGAPDPGYRHAMPVLAPIESCRRARSSGVGCAKITHMKRTVATSNSVNVSTTRMIHPRLTVPE